MPTSSTDLQFRVTGLVEVGPGRVGVSMTQVLDTEPGQPLGAPSGLTLNLSEEEAAGYFPGQTYKVSLSKNK